MKLNKLKDIKADEFMIFASLPDMGRVGGLVSSFLNLMSWGAVASLGEKGWTVNSPNRRPKSIKFSEVIS